MEFSNIEVICQVPSPWAGTKVEPDPNQFTSWVQKKKDQNRNPFIYRDLNKDQNQFLTYRSEPPENGGPIYIPILEVRLRPA